MFDTHLIDEHSHSEAGQQVNRGGDKEERLLLADAAVNALSKSFILRCFGYIIGPKLYNCEQTVKLFRGLGDFSLWAVVKEKASTLGSHG